MLKINNLKANVEKKSILNGFNLEIKEGEVHAIMIFFQHSLLNY